MLDFAHFSAPQFLRQFEANSFVPVLLRVWVMPGKRCALDHLGGHFCTTALFTASGAAPGFRTRPPSKISVASESYSLKPVERVCRRDWIAMVIPAQSLTSLGPAQRFFKTVETRPQLIFSSRLHTAARPCLLRE
jgi:hypothetical protein